MNIHEKKKKKKKQKNIIVSNDKKKRTMHFSEYLRKKKKKKKQQTKTFIVSTCNTKHIENKSYRALQKIQLQVISNASTLDDEMNFRLLIEIKGTSKARFIMILGIPQAGPLRYLNRQKMRKRMYGFHENFK